MRHVDRARELLHEGGLDGLEAGVRRFLKWRYRRLRDGFMARVYGIGSRRICPVCGWTGMRFLPYGQRQRPDARCPVCQAKERHRYLWHHLQKTIDLTDADVLYFAPVEGIVDRLQQRSSVNLLTTDLSEPNVDFRSDVTRLPVRDRCFDVIVFSHVLEHVPDETAALQELYRALRPGGTALVLLPQDRGREETYEDDSVSSPEERQRTYRQHDHVRLYGDDVRHRLARFGFDVTVVDYTSELPDSVVDQYGFREDPSYAFDQNVLFECVRPPE